MARPAATPTPATPLDVNEAAIAADAQALTVLSARSAEIAERFADGAPYDRERVVDEARFFMGQSAEAMLEAGKRLIQLKEHEPHGDFIEIVEQRLGLNKRTAQVMMQAAVKYLSPALAPKAQALALLGRTKMLDLLVENDEELVALAEGGTLAGLTLDDVDAMTSRELKAALRKAREDVEAKDKLLDAKNKKLDKLTTERKFKPSAERVARDAEQQAQLDELTAATNGAEVTFLRLAAVVDAINAGSSPAVRERATQAVQYLVKRLVEVVDEHGIDVSLDGLATERPAWLDLLPPDDDAPAAANH